MEYATIQNPRKIKELSQLSDLSDLPKTLYYRGIWDPRLFTSCVAIVGSRKMTGYGRRVIEHIVPALVFEKKTIVSGFMYGVDQYAHEVCVQSGGKTIAVLGWGIREEMGVGDRKLADDIVRGGGLIISEWENQKPTLWTFPVRNRIVAALAHEVIVIEAAIKSGSLITAHIAHKLHRKIWAVPGDITSPTSQGTNALIAKRIAYVWQNKPGESVAVSDGNPILEAVHREPLTASELARTLQMPVSEIGAKLSLLALEGRLVEREGKYYLPYARKD